MKKNSPSVTSCALVFLFLSAMFVFAGQEDSGLPISERLSPAVAHANLQAAPGITVRRDSAHGPLLDVAGRMATELRRLDGKAFQLEDLGEPMSLAAGHLDEDGIIDLLVGHKGESSGWLTVYRGNQEIRRGNAARRAIAEIRGEPVSPFTGPALVVPVSVNPQFMAVGDFNGDGFQDVAITASGEDRVVLLPGDGRGTVQTEVTVLLPGTVTAFASGDVNRRDGLEDLVIGLIGEPGPAVLVFESPKGALQADPEVLNISAPARSIGLGFAHRVGLVDVAVACGHEVVVFAGRDRELLLTPEQREAVSAPQRTLINADATVAAVVMADLAGDRLDEVAFLTEKGELKQHQLATTERGEVTTLLGLIEGSAEGVDRVDLLATRMSGSEHQDVLTTLVGEVSATLLGRSGVTRPARMLAEIRSQDPLVAALPVRLDGDALADLVLLAEGDQHPTVFMNVAQVTYVVNSTEDTDDSSCDVSPGDCTLREAINAANDSPLADVIEFDIGSTPITVGSTLPNITDQVWIDGEQSVGPIPIRAAINGNSNDIYGLHITGNNVTLSDLLVYGFGQEGIRISGADGNVIRDCWIGLQGNGTANGNGDEGILIRDGASDNTIGGTSAGDRNVISANYYNVSLYRGVADDPVTNNEIIGNYIGTTTSGTAARGGYFGVQILGASGNYVGEALYGNVISGQSQSGILIEEDAGVIPSNNLILGNLIGTNKDGDTAIANGNHGIYLSGSSSTSIGGTTAPARNVISGNSMTGIISHGGTNTSIAGNYIGVDQSGSTDLGNGDYGVRLGFSSLTTTSAIVGGGVAGASNVISGNGDAGILMNGGTASSSIIKNIIGLGADRTTVIPNAVGVSVDGAGSNIDIGGAGVGNEICGNTGNGISVSDTNGVQIHDNWIGRTQNADSDKGNGGHGVFIDSGCTGVEIGSSSRTNHILYNDGDGVALAASATIGNTTITNNSIRSNGGLAIDLGDDGVTGNDAGDGDAGANALQNFPLLTSATLIDDDSITIEGTLQSSAQTTYDLEFFANQSCDESGYGEADYSLGIHQVTTASNGLASFSVTFDESFTIGDYYSSAAATASRVDASGDETSELSLCIPMGGPCDVVLVNGTVTGTQLEESCGTILVGPNYAISATGDLTLRAAISVTLDNGTNVANGGTLTVEISP